MSQSSNNLHHIMERWLDTSNTWHSNDLTSSAGAPAYDSIDQLEVLAGLWDGRIEHVFSPLWNGHVQELYYDGNWHDRDLTSQTGAALAAP